MLYQNITKAILQYRRDCLKLEASLPGSFKKVVRGRKGDLIKVSQPQGNKARAAAREVGQKVQELLIKEGVSSVVAEDLVRKYWGAFIQAAPVLAELEARGLVKLLAFGEADAKGVTLERPIREIFKRFFPKDLIKDCPLKVIFNIESNARVIARAVLQGDVKLLGGIDKMFHREKTRTEVLVDSLISKFRGSAAWD